jgi:hypothetical protein
MHYISQIPLLKRAIDFVEWLSNGRRQILPAKTVDDLYTEIYKLENTLANAPTRPMRPHSVRPLEPITEQQKIMDLAG